MLLQQLGVSQPVQMRVDGRASLDYAGGRLDVYPLPGGPLICQVTLCSLGMGSMEEDNERISRLLRYSLTQISQPFAIMAHSHVGNSLVLQCALSDRLSGVDMQSAISQFLNAADKWLYVARHK